MISVDDFLEAVEEIASENPSYRNGGIGSDGTCDCIGLIMGAMYRCGHGKYALHGSNFFSRHQTVDLGEVEAHTKGMIVYKAREPTDSGYALPERYQDGGAYCNGDLLDYYHVGVVTSVFPIEITHCTSSGGVNGIKQDTTEREYRSWKCAGYVQDVKYFDSLPDGGDEAVSEKVGTVHSPDGNPVKLRKDPSTKNPYIAKVPDGADVTVHEQAGEWSTVSWNGKRGYMMSKFIEVDEEKDESSEPSESKDESSSLTDEKGMVLMTDDDLEVLKIDHAVMMETQQVIMERLNMICEKLGIAVDLEEKEKDEEEVNG